MTKKKPGAVRGRPRVLPEGRRVLVFFSDETLEALDAAAQEKGTDRSDVLREIVDAWARRRKARAR